MVGISSVIQGRVIKISRRVLLLLSLFGCSALIKETYVDINWWKVCMCFVSLAKVTPFSRIPLPALITLSGGHRRCFIWDEGGRKAADSSHPRELSEGTGRCWTSCFPCRKQVAGRPAVTTGHGRSSSASAAPGRGLSLAGWPGVPACSVNTASLTLETWR